MDTGPAAKEGATGPVAVQADHGAADRAATLLDGLRGTHPSLVLIFGAQGDDLAGLQAQLAPGLPPDCIFAGCSSAGEIGPSGYASDSVVAIGFPRRHFRTACLMLADLPSLPVSDWLRRLRRMAHDFAPAADRQLFGLLLSDGLTGQEDVVVATLDAALPGVPVLGGSAGDGLRFRRTHLLSQGQVLSDVAVFLLIETDLAIHEVTFAHFSPTPVRAVVTAAQPERRRILELNAEPAALEYARLTGLDPAALTPTEFARHPLLLRMGGRHHVRAISAITEDDGLSLMASVDTGTVLTLGRVEDLIQGFSDMLDALPGPPLMVLAFDCILRRLALERAGLTQRMSQLYRHHRVAGFNTYGEQHSGMHVNQTFVGLAFLEPPDAA